MNGIELMVEEHKAIKRMLHVIRMACYKVLNGEEVPYEAFDQMIDFVKNFADAHHHGKEENLFFNKMVDQLGPAAEKLVTHGMLVEHDLGRLHMAELKKALLALKAGDDEARLDVIANAIGYTHLLTRHIDKEDGVVFPFAQRSFSSESLEDIYDAFSKYEKAHEEVPLYYLNMLEKLEEIFL